jgi:hypothetical protein
MPFFLTFENHLNQGKYNTNVFGFETVVSVNGISGPKENLEGGLFSQTLKCFIKTFQNLMYINSKAM